MLEVRDLWPDFAVELGALRNPLLIGAARVAERFLYRIADRVVVNSPGFVEHVVSRGAPRDRVVVIPNGVDVAPFDPAARGETYRREAGAVPDDVLVVYAGAHGVPNDLDVVLDAADILRDEEGIRFALVGDGRVRAGLMERAERMELSNLVFVDAVPKPRMPEVLAAADILRRSAPALAFVLHDLPEQGVRLYGGREAGGAGDRRGDPRGGGRGRGGDVRRARERAGDGVGGPPLRA